MNPQQAIQFIQQALNDFAGSMPPSVRMAFVAKADEAFTTLLPPKSNLPEVPHDPAATSP